MLQQLAVLFNLSAVLHFHHLMASIITSAVLGLQSQLLPSLTQAVERTLQQNLYTVMKHKTSHLPLSLRVAAAL